MPENGITLLQSFIVKYKAFADKLVENSRCPLAKTRGSLTINAVTDADNGIKGIKSLITLDLTIAFLLNY